MSIYNEMYDFKNLYNAHRAARKSKRGKREVIDFEINLSQNLCNLQKQLEERSYIPKGYTEFKVYEPKERIIFAPDYSDRVVQHCLCDNIIYPTLDHRLIYDNSACRIGKGTHFSIYRLTKFLREFYQEYECDGYFLKCDIRKYFYSINKSILKTKLRKVFVDSDIFDLLCKIIDSYEVSKGIGLPLGNQTSQWFALYYLDSMDRFIKEQLRVKYYTRYMDDFILIHNNKDYLAHCLNEIKNHCENHLELELNEKTQIFPLKNGVNYLGWHFYLSKTGKVIRKIRNPSKKRIKKKYKLLQFKYSNRTIDFDDVRRSTTSIRGHLQHGHTYRFREKLCDKTTFVRKNKEQI
ncbi:MAG: RNA-directed DNA polymerase [Oscillospiraceae bacterium]|nr:RNA-directed DNA polymerase [Oscillospiraceae bacterium]